MKFSTKPFLEAKRELDVGAWDVDTMRFKERQLVDTDGKSRNHDRHGAQQARAATDRSLDVRQGQTVVSNRSDTLSWWL